MPTRSHVFLICLLVNLFLRVLIQAGETKYSPEKEQHLQEEGDVISIPFVVHPHTVDIVDATSVADPRLLPPGIKDQLPSDLRSAILGYYGCILNGKQEDLYKYYPSGKRDNLKRMKEAVQKESSNTSSQYDALTARQKLLHSIIISNFFFDKNSWYVIATFLVKGSSKKETPHSEFRIHKWAKNESGEWEVEYQGFGYW